jgi:hypothetical protein
MRAHRGLPARHVLREYFASFNLFSELQAHFDGVDPADVALEVEEVCIKLIAADVYI